MIQHPGRKRTIPIVPHGVIHFKKKKKTTQYTGIVYEKSQKNENNGAFERTLKHKKKIKPWIERSGSSGIKVKSLDLKYRGK